MVGTLFHNPIPLFHGPDPMEWLLNVGNHVVKPFSALFHNSTSFFATSFIEGIWFQDLLSFSIIFLIQRTINNGIMEQYNKNGFIQPFLKFQNLFHVGMEKGIVELNCGIRETRYGAENRLPLGLIQLFPVVWSQFAPFPPTLHSWRGSRKG